LVDDEVVTRLVYALASLLVVLPLSAAGANSTRSAHRAPQDTVAIIGDSLTDQRGAGQARIEEALRDQGRGGGGIYFWGVGGKRLVDPDSYGTTTLHNIRAARAELGHVDTWLIALGTNDRFSSTSEIRGAVDRILNALGPDDFVWIGLGFYDGDSAYSRRVNVILEEAIAGRPNGTYANWNRFVHHPGRDAPDLWTYPNDRLHMTEKGYLIRARYYARNLG
jgi:lysophospholipase L1-like esterase